MALAIESPKYDSLFQSMISVCAIASTMLPPQRGLTRRPRNAPAETQCKIHCKNFSLKFKDKQALTEFLSRKSVLLKFLEIPTEKYRQIIYVTKKYVSYFLFDLRKIFVFFTSLNILRDIFYIFLITTSIHIR